MQSHRISLISGFAFVQHRRMLGLSQGRARRHAAETNVRPTEMKSTRPVVFFLIVVMLLFSPRVDSMGDWFVCAVVEVDQAGGLWVNGHAGFVESSAIRECVANGIFVLAPEYGAPVGAVITATANLRARARPVKVLLPSLRREVNELFGMDTLLKCQEFSEHEIQPLPPRRESTDQEAVRLIRSSKSANGSSSVTALEMARWVSIGVADEVAESHGAYRQRGGVQFVASEEGERIVMRLAESDFWIPPPPKMEQRIVGGVEQLEYVSDRELCIYPISRQ